ncbi:hypothetical protein [Microbacterium sp. E-13]|uniref:hypothetical protein n=1 Tax=Microbacterium sp. E-13 TaxID=3404048 RepID=UPI003CEA24B5
MFTRPQRRTIASVATAAVVAAAVLGASPAFAAKPSGKGKPTPSPTVTAAPTPTIAGTLFATNSEANALSDQWHRSLIDLAISGDELYSSWGDYDDNVGPIALNSHNLVTGAQTHHLTVNGEELNALRVVDGAIYAADIDPKVGWQSNAGFATNAGGVWKYVAAAPFIHVFDVAVAGSEIFLAGSIVNPDTATYGSAPYLAAIKKSSDGGKTWTIEKTRSSLRGSNDYDRYYWLASVNGKVYAAATVVDANGYQNRIIDVYASGSWSTVTLTSSSPATVVEAHHLVTFGTKIIGKSINNSVFVYDTAAKKADLRGATLGTRGGVLVDLYADGSTIYGLVRANEVTADDTLYSSKDGLTWTPVMNIDIPVANWSYTWHNGQITTEMRGTATSVAVKDGRFYFGTNLGTIYKASL